VTSKLNRLAEIGALINASLDLDKVLNKALELSTVLLGASASSILIFDPHCHELIFTMVHGDKKEKLIQKRVSASEGIAGCVLNTQMGLMIENVKNDPRFSSKMDESIAFETKNILAYPLSFGNKKLGVLEILNKKNGLQFNKEDLEIVKILATQISIAIHHAMMHEQILMTQKLSVLGELTASVAHEMKSPLSALKGFSTLIKENLEKQQVFSQNQMLFAGLESAVHHLNKIASKLLDFSRKNDTQKTLLALENVLEQAHQLTRHEISKHDLIIEKNIAVPLQINGNTSELTQVFTNLIINACQASPPGKTIKLQSQSQKEYVEIMIQDEGTGIAPQVLPHIFESFYSTKGSKGNGLGLAISKEIVERHGGKIEVESIVGQGTTFKVLLPKQ
jgi:signal transduction histidine kinase